MSSAVVAHDLSFGYPGGFRLALSGLDIERGSQVACIGPSGCGKTTLLHLLAGILAPQAGSLRVEDFELAGASDVERRRFRLERIGLVFQEFALLEHLSVRENALLPWLLEPGRRRDATVEASLQTCAEAVGIDRLLDRRPRSLSQGERQRVALCRALIGSPRLVLADEPTGNLDPETSARAVELMLDETRRSGATLVMVTHERDALSSFERVIDLGEGVGGPA